MSGRQYELVYILPPDTTEQQVTELHQQIEAVVLRMNGHSRRQNRGDAASWRMKSDITRRASTSST